MSITEKISHAAERKAFETVLDSLIKKGQTQDAGKIANDLVNMVQKLHGDVWSEASFQTLHMLANDPNGKWAHYVQRLIRDNDPYILKTFLTNAVYEGGIRGYHVAQETAKKYDVNVPWLILMDPTSACKLAVVLEVDAVQFLAAGKPADLPYTVFHIRSLLRRQQQGCVSVQANRHVVEIPRENTALGNQKIQELVAGDDLVVLAGVADGDAEGDAVTVHQLHRIQGFLEMALSTTAIVGFLKTLHADGHEEVAHPQHLLTEFLVDEGAVGKGMEGNIPVLFTKADDVLLPQQRLAAGKEAGMGA